MIVLALLVLLLSGVLLVRGAQVADRGRVALGLGLMAVAMLGGFAGLTLLGA